MSTCYRDPPFGGNPVKYELDMELAQSCYPFNYGLPSSVWGTTVQACERTVNLVLSPACLCEEEAVSVIAFDVLRHHARC
jgi:hypothetical protein